MNQNQKIYFTNCIGIIYESKIKFFNKPNDIININTISYIELNVIKLKSITNLLYAALVILLIFDLYFHYSGTTSYEIRAVLFLILILSVNLKIKKKQIRILDLQNNEIIISIKRKDILNAKLFIKEFNSKKFSHYTLLKIH